MNKPPSSVPNLNRKAMKELSQHNHHRALQLLTTALSLAHSHADPNEKTRYLLITHNNLGCYYKQMGLFEQALTHLFECVELETQCETKITNKANVHLNISAILSEQI